MALAASREGIPFGEAAATVEKRMTPPPRRIGELVLNILMPSGLTRAHRARLEEVAHGCPVARSLHPDLKLHVTFGYPDEPTEGWGTAGWPPGAPAGGLSPKPQGTRPCMTSPAC